MSFFLVRNFFIVSLIIVVLLFLPNTILAVSSVSTSSSPISTLKILLKIESVNIMDDNFAVTLDCGKFGKFEYSFTKDTLEQDKQFDSNVNVSCKLLGKLTDDQSKKFKLTFGDNQGSDNNYISGTPAKEFNGKSIWATISQNTDQVSTTSTSAVSSVATEPSNSTTTLETSSSSSSSKSTQSSTTISTKSSSKSSSSSTSTSKSTKSSSSSKTSSSSSSSSKKSSTSTIKSASSSKTSTSKTKQVKGTSSLAKTGADVNQYFYILLIIFFGALFYMSISRRKIF